MANKTTFTTQMKVDITELANLYNSLRDAVDVFFDRGYNSGGADPIVDGDITDLDVTAANVGSAITLTQQLTNFFENAAVAQGDYDLTLSVMRGDH